MFTTLSDARKIQERIYSAATCCGGTRNVSPGFVLKYSQDMWGNYEHPDGKEAHGLCAELDVVYRLLQSFEKSAVYWNVFMNSKQGYSVAEFDFFIIVPEGVLLLEVKNYSQNAEWRAGRQPDTWEKVANGQVVDILSDPFRQIRRAKERLEKLLANFLRLPAEVKVGRVLVTPNVYVPVTDPHIKVVTPDTMCEDIDVDRAFMRTRRSVDPAHFVKLMACMAREGVFPDFYDPALFTDMAASAGRMYSPETVQSVSPLDISEPTKKFGFVSYGSVRMDTHRLVMECGENAPLYQAQFMKALAAVNEQVTRAQFTFPASKVFSRDWLQGEMSSKTLTS